MLTFPSIAHTKDIQHKQLNELRTKEGTDSKLSLFLPVSLLWFSFLLYHR
jgi:hypothetical protein